MTVSVVYVLYSKSTICETSVVNGFDLHEHVWLNTQSQEKVYGIIVKYVAEHQYWN